MSERTQFRGGRGGGRGRGRGGGQGGGHGEHSSGGRGGRGGGHHQEQTERPKKENILDLKKYVDKSVKVKFNGGREVTGVLKGFDQLMNLVLDDVEELMRDDEGNERTRSLGLIVARGTLLVLISPMDGSMPIANPFLQQGEGGGVGMSVCDSGYLARAASCFIDIAKGTHYSKASNSWKDGLDVLAEHDTERSDQSYHHWDCAWPGAGFMKRNIWWNTCGSSHSTTNGSMALVVTGNGVLLLIEREPRWRRI